MALRRSPARSPACDTFQPSAEPSVPGPAHSEDTNEEVRRCEVGQQEGGSHLGDDVLQFLGSAVTADSEVREPFSGSCLSLDQLLPELLSLLFGQVSIACQMLFHPLVLCLI